MGTGPGLARGGRDPRRPHDPGGAGPVRGGARRPLPGAATRGAGVHRAERAADPIPHRGGARGGPSHPRPTDLGPAGRGHVLRDPPATRPSAGSSSARLLVPLGSDRVALPREVALVLRGGPAAPHLPSPAPGSHRARASRLAWWTPSPAVPRATCSPGSTSWRQRGARSRRASCALVACPSATSRSPSRCSTWSRNGRPSSSRCRMPLGWSATTARSCPSGLPPRAGRVVGQRGGPPLGGRRPRLAGLHPGRAPRRARVGDSPANALGPDAQWPAIRGIRREVLAELAMLEPGTAADPDSIRERLGWRRPLRPAGPLSVAIEGVLREAEWLGVTGRGAMSSPDAPRRCAKSRPPGTKSLGGTASGALVRRGCRRDDAAPAPAGRPHPRPGRPHGRGPRTAGGCARIVHAPRLRDRVEGRRHRPPLHARLDSSRAGRRLDRGGRAGHHPPVEPHPAPPAPRVPRDGRRAEARRDPGRELGGIRPL